MGNFLGNKNRFATYICYHLEYIWDSDWLIDFITQTYSNLYNHGSSNHNVLGKLIWFCMTVLSPWCQSQVLHVTHGLDVKQYQMSWPIEVKLRWVGLLYLLYCYFRTYWLFYDSIKQWKLHQSFCDFNLHTLDIPPKSSILPNKCNKSLSNNVIVKSLNLLSVTNDFLFCLSKVF